MRITRSKQAGKAIELLLAAGGLFLLACGSRTSTDLLGADGGTIDDSLSGCGDGVCAPSEHFACPADCPPAPCGDDSCDRGESYATCPYDCARACGNGTCDQGETTASCIEDCWSDRCGDGICDEDEKDTCAMDCRPAFCGNQRCDRGETVATCPSDCILCGDAGCVPILQRPSDCDVRCQKK